VGGMTGLAAGPDGQTLAVHGRYDSTVQLWTLADAAPRERLRLPNYGSVPSPMAFAPDGQAFINATYGPVSYCALTADKPHPVNLQPPHTARPVALAFAPDGKTFASAGSTDQTVRLWDATRPEPKERGVIKFKDPGLQALALAFTADARTLAVLASDRKVHLWDVEGATPEPRGTPLADLSTSPAGIGFSPDGKVLVVIGDGRAALYDWAGPRPSLRTAFGGAQGNGTNIVITSLAFSPDGKQVAVSATGPEAVLLYDAVSGKRLRSWTLLGLVHAVDFGADSRHLFVANGNGTVYVLRLARPVAAGK